MEAWQKFLETSSLTTKVLEKYIEIRMYLKELGHTEESIQRIKTAPGKLWRLKEDLTQLNRKLWQQLDGYGFDIPWSELVIYLQPKMHKIDLEIPLNDDGRKKGNNRRK